MAHTKLQFKHSTEEWVVVFYDDDGHRNEARTYYTTDKEDALNTQRKIQTDIDTQCPTMAYMRGILELFREHVIQPIQSVERYQKDYATEGTPKFDEKQVLCAIEEHIGYMEALKNGVKTLGAST
jgi:hypothetical protein